MTTTNRESLDNLLTLSFAHLMIGKEYPNAGQLVDAAMKVLATHDKQLHQALLSGLPERNSMKHAVNAHSDAGAGYVIGFNYCLEQVTQLINQVFNKEPGL